MSKKRFFIILLSLLLLSLCACGALPHTETTSPTEPEPTVTVPAEPVPTPTTVPTKAPADLVLSDPEPLEPMAVETLDPDAFGGVNGIIIYEDEDNIIFFTDYGLFDYDLVECKITHSFDFLKAYRTLGGTQGDYGTYASASPDGTRIVVHYVHE